jgi:uncharacterized protein (TIGR00369 family)
MGEGTPQRKDSIMNDATQTTSPPAPQLDVTREVPVSGIEKLLGMARGPIAEGKAELTLEADERSANPQGTVHGGVIGGLADTAMGFALASTLAAGESFTTLEYKVNFLRPAWRGRLAAQAQVLRKGRTVSLVTCDVLDAQGALVAHAVCTCMTLRGEQAHGR